MAYLNPVHKPKCHCGKGATVQLLNFRNAPSGWFCTPHGNAALKAQNEREASL